MESSEGASGQVMYVSETWFDPIHGVDPYLSHMGGDAPLGFVQAVVVEWTRPQLKHRSWGAAASPDDDLLRICSTPPRAKPLASRHHHGPTQPLFPPPATPGTRAVDFASVPARYLGRWYAGSKDLSMHGVRNSDLSR